jgi:hypothetical protein
MIDSLSARAQLAIEESVRLRRQRRMLEDSHDRLLDDLRRSTFESAMYRSEIKSLRDNRE